MNSLKRFTYIEPFTEAHLESYKYTEFLRLVDELGPQLHRDQLIETVSDIWDD